MSSGLSDKAIDHAEPEPRTLTKLFGREERLKHPILHFARHSAAVICDGQANVRSWRTFRHAQFHHSVLRLDAENTSFCHGVPSIQGEVKQSGLQQSRIDM